MADIVVLDTPSTLIEIVSIGTQGPPGPPGDAGLPDAATLANGRMLAVLDGVYVDVAPTAGTGDMNTLIYDPSGVASDVYNAQNLVGFINCGEF